MVAASPGSPDLLGETDTTLQECMKKGYPYISTMGGGQFVNCTDFHQAADILLQRNYPDVFNKSQTATVFIPVGTRQEMETAVQRFKTLVLNVVGRRRLNVNPCLVNQAAGWRRGSTRSSSQSAPNSGGGRTFLPSAAHRHM